MNYLENLNDEQKKAVLATEGPVLIVAGAGAGKTKTITHRILHLMHGGVSAGEILAITFTNKAAKEMRDRVRDMLGRDSDMRFAGHGMPFVSTFHSLGVLIIKENAELLKLPRHFTIFDTADSKKALKDALMYIGVEPKEHLDTIRHIISGEKGRGVSFADYRERQAFDYTSEITKKAWARYEEILTREHALDFDDLLLKTLKLLEQFPDVLARYQNRFRYIHIDEYQDTNKVQNRIVELIAAKYKNICVVGDTDQNIYSWRGAEIKHMLHFEKTYPNAQTIFLEQNYRSTKTILAVANEIIKKNNFRIPKNLFTENMEGELLSLFSGRDETDEAHFIAMTCGRLIAEAMVPDKIAVLYRANFQSRVLEEAFLAYGVPYQLLGTKFFERKEIKDVLSYVKASLSPESTTDFVRIVNTPARGIGKVTLEKILAEGEEDLPGGTRIKLNVLREMLQAFRTKLITEKVSDALKYIIQHSGMEKMYESGKEEDVDRLENVMELVTLAKQYDDFAPEEGVEKFLTDSALASDQDTLDQPKTGVKLMTVHSSKGLEFDTVFISGLEADLFPHSGFGQDRKTKEESEEERRLFYVALTRAERKLFLTYAETRTIFGNTEVNVPSEFIGDIPGKYIERETYGGVRVERPLVSITF
jgi:DNA helicase-2/ATP-dependent DNA helicase PcrA